MRENVYLGAEAIVRMMQEVRRKELESKHVPVRRDLEMLWSVFAYGTGAFCIGLFVYLWVNW